MTTIATWNVGDGHDDRKLWGLKHLVDQGVEVVGLQEAGDRERLIGRFCDELGWHAWLGDGSPGATSVPILWDPTAVDAVRTGTRRSTPATKTGPLGAGPSTVKAKVWNYVRFAEVGDDDLVVNGHNPASVWAPRRRQLAQQNVDVLADFVEHRHEAVDADRVNVIAVMDGNAKPSDRLWLPLRELHMQQHTHAPTHGRRTIDLVWTLGVRGSAVVTPMPSDHRAVIFTTKEHHR